MMLKNVRLVIPTYERADYLSRALAYYSRSPITLPITVADSSGDETFAKNTATIARYLDMPITHDRYPSELNPHYKFAQARQAIAEKYSVLASDDDFLCARICRTGRRVS